MDVSIRPLKESDLKNAEQIFRLAFGTFLGVPDPANFSGDKAFIRSRWHADHTAAFGAEIDGRLVGSNIATRWGSVGFLGPLTVLPDYWNRGIGKLLMEPVVNIFDRWGCRHTGLYTFAESQKHIGLYQHYGFWPRFLTPIMSKAVQPAENKSQYSKYSDIPKNDQKMCLDACFKMTNLIFDGLTLEHEIATVYTQGLGDTVFIRDGEELAGLAVCYCGSGTEAGQDTCYVKFGAVRPGALSGERFKRLLNACELLAAEKTMSRLVAGVNTARHQAYQSMLEQGFKVDMIGIIMQRPNEAGYNRSDIYLVDDWR
ncbi:MAG: GNAT family N-acetyltransferase [Deltaproteobacteria bacterium]|nr:GNAT family N-acetyltransferase [Deltaproteobacteria bacterium]